MKVLHISSEKSWRGGEQQIAYLIEESLSRGVECTVLVRKDSSFMDWLEKKGISYRNARFKNSLDLSTAIELKRVVANLNPDLIHLHSGNGHGIYSLAYLLGLRTPAILSRRVDFPIKKNPWSKFKYGLPTIKRMITVSNEIAEIIKPSIKSPEKVTVIHSGIDLSRFSESVSSGILRKEYGIDEDVMLIGNTSALAPHKDYPTFLRACREVKEMGIKAKFFIIGKGPDEVSIRNKTDELNLGDDVIMTGFRDDIPAILPELDIFLISSETEGLGTSILDAFACKVPVVATRAGGIPELVTHEETGLLCPVSDYKCLAHSVIRLISNADLRRRVVQKAHEKLEGFTKEKTASATLDLYREVLDEV